MAKKTMEDIKSKGVRITKILKKDVDPSFKEKPISRPPSTKEEDFNIPVKNIEEKDIKKEESIKTKVYINQQEMAKRLYSTPREKSKSGGMRRSFLILLIASVFIGGVYFISNSFESANISVIAKKQSFNLNNMTLNASNNSDANVNFELMIVSNEEYKDFKLSNPQEVSIKAKGTITLYNENSTKPQNLLINTFVADEKGKTYNTDKAVTIPGYKLDSSKKIIPGQVDVGITAFLPGDSYNGTPKTLTITGFKGTAKAKTIYAKLKTPLVGGAQGTAYTLSPNDKGSVTAFAQSTFKSNLLKKVNAEVPKGYILYPNATEFYYNTEEDVLSPTANAKVKVSGTISTIILNEKDLSKAIMKKLTPTISQKELEEVSIPDISNLSFNFKNQGQSIVKDISSVDFNLTGDINAIWSPDVESLKSILLGARKTDLVQIFKSDPGIASATARIFPPWQSYLPQDPSKIHINVK